MAHSNLSMTRRRFLAGLAAAGGAAALVACGTNPREQDGGQGGGNGQGTGAQGGTAPAKQAGAVSFVNWGDIKDTPLETVIQDYEKQTGNKVEVVPTPGTGTDYETKIRTMLAGGTAPDIMRTNDDFVRYYSVKEQVLDLNPYIQRDNVNMDEYFAPVMKFARQPDNKYTAWSLGNQPRMIYYNVDMFKEAGVPLPPKEWVATNWTWDDFLETAKKLTKGNDRWGALVYDDTGYEQTWAVNNGEEDGIYAADGKTFTLANPKGTSGIQWAIDLTCKHQVQPERGLVSESNSGNNLFAGGKVGMIFRTASTANYFRRNAKDFEWDVAPVPANVHQKSEGSLICFTITKNAKNPDGAWKLLHYMGGPEGSKVFAEAGYFVPAYKKSAELIKPGDKPPANIQLFSRAMDFATVVNFTENTERARNIYRQELDLAYTCQQTAQEVLNRVKPDVEAALAGKF